MGTCALHADSTDRHDDDGGSTSAVPTIDEKFHGSVVSSLPSASTEIASATSETNSQSISPSSLLGLNAKENSGASIFSPFFDGEGIRARLSVEERSAIREAQKRKSAAFEKRAHEEKKRIKAEGLVPRPFGQWAIHALFLGRKLPGGHSAIGDTEVFYTFCAFVAQHSAELDPRVLSVVLDFCDMHMIREGKDIDGIMLPSSSRLLFSLEKLMVGGYWSTWIQAQNALLFIERTSENFARVSMWPIQPPANKVMGVVPGYIRIPEEAFEVPWTTISTEAFVNRVAEMSTTTTMEKNELDVATPTFVKDYLLPALGGDAIDLTQPGHCIAKKIHDDSRLREGTRPWRRPCAWLALKSLLHYACLCTDRIGGQALYKRLQMSFLVDALGHVEHNLLDDSAIVEASRKVARRLYKLQAAGALGNVLSVAGHAVQQAMQPVKLRWHDLCEETNDASVAHQNLDFEKDVVHRLSNSRPVLNSILQQKVTAKHTAQQNPKCTPRFQNASELFSGGVDYLSGKNRNHDDIVTSLYDAERSVMSTWERWDSSGKMPVGDREMQEVLPFLNAYLSLAQEVYKSDIEGRSRMVLTIFTIAMLVDRSACKEYPQLLSHAVGLEDTALSYLVLADAYTKKILNSLEMYMASRRKKQIEHRTENHTSILHAEIHEHAFSVKFAKKDEDMQNTLRRISELIEKGKTKKQDELKEELRKHADFRERGDKLDCICKGYKGPQNNRPWCMKCICRRRADNMGLDFFVSILPVPEDEFISLAVVFELRIPRALATLRTVLHTVTQACSYFEPDPTPVLGVWTADEALSEHRRDRHTKHILGKEEATLSVQLVYTEESGLLNKTKHVMGHPTFCEYNGRDARFADVRNGRLLSTCPRWSVQEMLRIETSDPLYQALQFAIESWNHTENMAIALKGTAPKDLSLREFESFACVRAGVHLQFPRLLKALTQQTLSFDRRGVLDLLTAILMQVGPAARDGSGGPGVWRRQAHKVFECQQFCDDFCSHATVLLEQQATNWNRHRLLLAVINMGHCVLQHAPDGHNAAALLLACRDIACKWIGDIKLTMATTSDDEAVQKLRFKLVDIAASAILTYDVAFPGLLQSSQHAQTFLWLRAVVSDNIILGNIKVKKTASFRLNLLRRGLIVTLGMEDALYKILARTDALTGFVKQYWVGQATGKFGKWKQHSESAKRWYETVYTGPSGSSTLQMDVLRGTFLVNGVPVGHLPASICSHEDYARLFGDAVFEVQPISGGGWQTSVGADGSKFSFLSPSKPDECPIIMEERAVDGKLVRAQLVSHHHFKEDVPEELVEQYSHWLVRDSQGPKVFFRPRRYSDKAFHHGCKAEGATYILDVHKGIIVETAQNRKLVDVQSATFAELYDCVFFRVSPRSRVHAFHSATSNMVILPGLQGLQFHVEGEQLRSHEFGSLVALDQRLGTLVGLRHGLVLEDPSTRHKTLLMPHAAAYREFGTHSVHVKIDQLRQPPVFVYNVRDDLRELHGQKDRLAWLYLAKLHALTASPLPDPFLGQTGTSQALRLLCSGHCRGNLDGSGGWASALADTTLMEIAQCSAERRLIKKSKVNFAEKDNLPDHPLPALCAHDGFAWVASAMRREAKQAAEFAGVDLNSKQDTKRDINADHFLSHLSRRAYLRSRELFAADARLPLDDEVEILGPQRSMLSIRPWPIEFSQLLERKSLRVVAASFQKNRAVSGGCDLSTLLLKHFPALRGFTETSWPEKAIDQWQMLLEQAPPFDEGHWLAHVWLDFYGSAQECTGEDRNDRITQLQLCCSFLAQQDPSMTDYLLPLSVIALNAEAFAHITPPKHTKYTNAHEFKYTAGLIFAEIDKQAKIFATKSGEKDAMKKEIEHKDATQDTHSDSYGHRWAKDQLDQLRDDPLGNKSNSLASSDVKEITAAQKEQREKARAAIEEAARKAFVSGKTLSSEKCQHPCVADTQGLCHTINSMFERWRAAAELHDFVKKVNQQVRTIESQLGKSSPAISMGSVFPAAHELQPATCHLPPQKARHVELAPQDTVAWTQGDYSCGHELDGAFAAKSPTPTVESPTEVSVPPQLPIKINVASTKMYEVLLKPMREAWELASSVEDSSDTDRLDSGDFAKQVQQYLQHARNDKERILFEIQKALAPEDDASGALQACGLGPAAVPTLLLKRLLPSNSEDSENWRTAIGALAFYLKHEQRAQRCLSLLHRSDYPALDVELRSHGCEGWVPKDRPEWLLLEIDNNFCIRSQQATVAQEIMSGDKGNRLLQLIMGAGKTAVIVPMIIASLANGEKCVRVTVIDALCATNATDWQYKLGGLLAKRVFSLICRREMKLERHCPQILGMLKDIHQKGHVLVTVPEHRLSLENKAWELAIARRTQDSLALREIIQYLALHGRDILDESDEILHPKFQLIYTLGHPFDLDGSSMRWIVGAAVLHSVARHAKALCSEFGVNAIEIKESDQAGVNQQFPFVRLLDQAKDGGYARLCELIADDFIAGAHPRIPVFLKPGEVFAWRRVVLDKTAPESDWQSLPNELHKFTLLLRGILAHGVLLMALHKRWRVDYGAHPHGLRQMAVPYRAKDVAAEKTEFGHPETALLLTTLHYYHGGLSCDQLKVAFGCLNRKGTTEAAAIYGSWVQGAPTLSVRTWAGVNLDDVDQFTNSIVPALCRHMQVIDFWLDQVVFPREAKQYPKKLVSTPWDLCRADTPCITTGFSGTDDAHLLLPLTISQVNMQDLKATNGALLHNLLRKENDSYFALQAGATGREVLNHVSHNHAIDVLLDPGALVLEISNRAVAELWLEARKDRQAAVYFEGNRIHVVDRLGCAMPLAVSPFESSLKDCLLYLDDEHTRGSDFQLPIGRRAVVTLGKGMQKDKLLQAVMRMRRLGQGHSVSFVASFEAHLQISTLASEHVISLGEEYSESRALQHLPAILSWCLNNTVMWTCDKLLYLAAQGVSHLRKRHASLCHAGNLTMMAAACAEMEQVNLNELYGHASQPEFLPQVVSKLLSNALSSWKQGKDHAEIVNMVSMLEEHVSRIASDVVRSSGLCDEEHERELEEELEEEREIENARPDVVTPCNPRMSPGLVEFARSGQAKRHFLSVSKIFEETSFAHLASDFKEVQVTQDFIHTVLDEGYKDTFLRPVTWTLVAKNGSTVLVSNFEAEELATNFFNREGNTALSLIVPAVRQEQAAALPSLCNHPAPSIAIQVLAGSVFGDVNFMHEVRAFLGICERQPASPAWRQLFEERNAIGIDGFVVPDFRKEVAATLNIELGSTFTSTPIPLLRRLYTARHLDDLLLTSQMGEILPSTDTSALTKAPKKRITKTEAAKPKSVPKPQKAQKTQKTPEANAKARTPMTPEEVREHALRTAMEAAQVVQQVQNYNDRMRKMQHDHVVQQVRQVVNSKQANKCVDKLWA